MTRFSPSLALLLAATALAACGQDDSSNIAIDASKGAAGETEVLPPDETTAPAEPASPPAAVNDAAQASAIPAAFHGRWGMVPADCTSTRGDAKGLIAIDGDSIKFYESRARLTDVTGDAPENFTGTFAFTGEGQEWTKSQNLKLTGSSNGLIRSEQDGSYRYTRCA